MDPRVHRRCWLAISALSAGALAGCESTPILLYHSVGETRPRDRWVGVETLRAELELLLAEGYTPVTARELDAIEDERSPSPPRPIGLTFDDGYRNFYLHAFPILRELGIRASMFLPVDRIRDDRIRDDRIRDPQDGPGELEYLTWAEVEEMASEGIEFESHSRTHPRLRGLLVDAAREEIFDSKAILETRLGRPVTVFAYPGGSFDGTTERLVEEAGYSSGLSVSSGMNGRFDRQRISIHEGTSLSEFRAMIGGTWWGTSSGAR